MKKWKWLLWITTTIIWEIMLLLDFEFYILPHMILFPILWWILLYIGEIEE